MVMIVMIRFFDLVFIKSHSILIVIQRKLVILIDSLIGISGIVSFIVYQFVVHKLYKVADTCVKLRSLTSLFLKDYFRKFTLTSSLLSR